MSGAMHHYREALRMQPGHPYALKYLLIPSCHVKFSLKKPPRPIARPNKKVVSAMKDGKGNVKIKIAKNDPAPVDSSVGPKGIDHFKAPVYGACDKNGEHCPEISSRSGEPVELVDRLDGPPALSNDIPEEDNGMIYCIDGSCRYVTKEEIQRGN